MARHADSPKWQAYTARRYGDIEQRRDRIVELTRRGMTVHAIAEAVGVCAVTVVHDRQARGMRMQGGEVAEQRRRRVAELTGQGLSAPQIADILKVTARTVTRDRKRAGISQGPAHRLTEEEIAVVERLLADGASLAECARTIGRHPTTLHKIKRFRGRTWTRQQCAEYMAICRLGRCG